MELEGRKGLVDTGGSSRAWSVPTVSLHLAVLNVFQGFFGPKMAVFGPELQFLKLRSATCEPRSRAPLSSFLLKLCVIVLHTHRYHPPKFHVNLKHHDGVLIFSHFARAACCLLAAVAAPKPGRSTLDTKKGYKTKTGSTSSVTLALTLIPALTSLHSCSNGGLSAMFGHAMQRSCMAVCVFCSTLLRFVLASKLGINLMDLGLMCLSLCGHRRRQPWRRRKMMMVFVANCVATVMVIHPSVAHAT